MSETPSSTDKSEGPSDPQPTETKPVEAQTAPKASELETPATSVSGASSCGCQSILDWPGEVWAFLILRISLGVRCFTAGLEKFRGPQFRLNKDQMMGITENSTPEQIKAIQDNPDVFHAKLTDFVHGELAEKYEGDNGLDPEKVKEAFGEEFFTSYVEHFETPVIDFAKLPGDDPALILDPFIQETLTDKLANDNGGLDMEKIASTFGEQFAGTAKFFEEDGGEMYFTDELIKVLTETPKDQLAGALGEDALTPFVQYIGDEFGRHVIQSGTQFSPKLVDLLAQSTNADQLAKSMGPDAHAQIIDGVKKSITHFGPDSIDTSYVYTLDHYYANQAGFLKMQEGWYANFPIMPQWSLKPFVYGLGYFLVIFGITTFLGIKTRFSLVGMALTYTALSFGAGLLAAAKTSDPSRFNLLITMLFVHIFVSVYALTLSKHEKFALVK